MQLNKVLKGLMIALPVMAIAACSSNKNASNDQSGEGMLGAGTGMDANGNGGNMSSEEQARLQMQQLQQNNIVYFDPTATISVLTSLLCWTRTLTSCAATRPTK